jgi:hypothetical protein
MCDIYRKNNRLIHYEPTYELTWEEANTFTVCKRCGQSDKLSRYLELRQESIEAYVEGLEDWTDVDTTDSDYGNIEGLRI